MEILALIPGVISAVMAFSRSAQHAFLNVYLPVLILCPEYYRWIAPGLPDPAFSQATVLPIGVAYVIGEASKWQASLADFLVFGFAFCVGYSEYLNAGYNEAQNLMFDMLTWVIFPYILGKGLIEPHNLAIPFAKRLVFLIFIISIVSVYEFKMGVTPWKLVLQRFFPWQGEGWVTTFRWGFARVAGPYGHAILAGVMLITGYRIQRWLEWSQQWEPRFRNGSGLPVSKARMITIGLVLGVLMTMVRGPWIAGILAAVLTGIWRAKNRWRAVGIIGVAMIVIGTPTVIAFKSYVSVGREGATSVAQESAAYRKELMDKYIAIALERSIWGWGRTTWPKIPGMPSIDNYYLLLALMHGVLALGFLLLIFLMMMTRLFIHSMRSPPAEPRGSCLSFTLLGIYVAFGFSIATVYMGGQVIPLFFLMTGWSEGYLLSGRESTGALPTQAAYIPPFRFQRVMV